MKMADYLKNLYLLARSYYNERLTKYRARTTEIHRDVDQGCPEGPCCAPGSWITMHVSFVKLVYPEGVPAGAFCDDFPLMVDA